MDDLTRFLRSMDGPLTHGLFGDRSVVGGDTQPESAFDEGDELVGYGSDETIALYLDAMEEICAGLGYVTLRKVQVEDEPASAIAMPIAPVAEARPQERILD